MFRSLLVLVLSVLCSFKVPFYNEADRKVALAAQSQLPIYLSKIQRGQEKTFGFTEQDDLDDCTVGKPIRIMEFSRSFFDTTVQNNVEPLSIKNEWRVPVQLKGQSRALISISGNSGNYTATGLGSVELARELQEKVPDSTIKEEDQYYILRIYPFLAEFLVHEENKSFEEAKFIPLNSAKVGIPGLIESGHDWYTLDEVQAIVKRALYKKPEDEAPIPKQKTKPKKTVKKVTE